MRTATTLIFTALLSIGSTAAAEGFRDAVQTGLAGVMDVDVSGTSTEAVGQGIAIVATDQVIAIRGDRNHRGNIEALRKLAAAIGLRDSDLTSTRVVGSLLSRWHAATAGELGIVAINNRPDSKYLIYIYTPAGAAEVLRQVLPFYDYRKGLADGS